MSAAAAGVGDHIRHIDIAYTDLHVPPPLYPPPRELGWGSRTGAVLLVSLHGACPVLC